MCRLIPKPRLFAQEPGLLHARSKWALGVVGRALVVKITVRALDYHTEPSGWEGGPQRAWLRLQSGR